MCLSVNEIRRTCDHSNESFQLIFSPTLFMILYDSLQCSFQCHPTTLPPTQSFLGELGGQYEHPPPPKEKMSAWEATIQLHSLQLNDAVSPQNFIHRLKSLNFLVHHMSISPLLRSQLMPPVQLAPCLGVRSFNNTLVPFFIKFFPLPSHVRGHKIILLSSGAKLGLQCDIVSFIHKLLLLWFLAIFWNS